MNPQKILNDALSLPEKDRAFIAHHLLSSLDASTDYEIELAWQQEIEQRLRQVDNEAVELISWEEVKKRIKARERKIVRT